MLIVLAHMSVAACCGLTPVHTRLPVFQLARFTLGERSGLHV
jgi:hypothetical protein